jgi:hypothetical protein
MGMEERLWGFRKKSKGHLWRNNREERNRSVMRKGRGREGRRGEQLLGKRWRQRTPGRPSGHPGAGRPSGVMSVFLVIIN